MPPELSRSGHGAQPWTAARCHRLLRQLQSRLAGLRKLASTVPSPPAKRPCPAAGDLPQAPKRVRLTYGQKRPAPAPNRQPEDATTTPRATRTLGAMELGASPPPCGLVDLSTPVWRKITEQPDTPRDTVGVPQNGSSEIASSDLVCDLLSMRRTVSGDRYRSYEAILGWLNGLLRSTMAEDKEPHRKSLLGLCLRRMPACITNIEAYERQVARDRGCQTMWDASNVSFDLYEQLEALGSPGSGWRPMKLTVRAHAMSLLTEAISDGLLEPEYVRLLVRLCLQLNCGTDAGKLAASVEMPLLGPRHSLSSLTESRQFLPLREMLQSFKGRTSHAVTLQWLSSLFKRGLLPVSCLCTRPFSAVLESSLEFITTSRSGSSVAAFLSACLPLLAVAGPENPANQRENTEQTLISIVAGVVAAATAMTGARGIGKEQKRRRAWRRVLFMLDHCHFQVRRQVGRRRRQQFLNDNGLFIFALARHLTVAKSPFADMALQNQAATELKDVARGAESSVTIRLQYYQATTLICWLAQYRSKSCAMSIRESVTELCSRLDGLGLDGCFGSGLRTDVAFVLAQKTKDLRDLAFAESLRGAEGPAKVSTMFSGWHWEEGISEWVLPDQGADQKAKQVVVENVPQDAGQPSAFDRYQGSRAGKDMLAVKVTRNALSPRRHRDSTGADLCHRNRGKGAMSKGSQSTTSLSSSSSSRLAKIRRKSIRLSRPVLGLDDWDDLV